MALLYSVPGLAESTLLDTTPLHTTIWMGLPTLIAGTFGGLRLAPDGTSPGPPDGIELQVGDLFAVYSYEPTVALAMQVAGDGYITRRWPWDWRKSVLTAGDALAADIAASVTADDPCAIISHSAGGLVARRAWSTLVASGQQALVRRIVTLGTPHWGSYQVAIAWGGSSPIIDLLRLVNRVVGGSIFGFTTLPAYRQWTIRQIADLLLTFPSFYESLPSLSQPGWQTADPNRIDLYTAGNWGGGVLPQQVWLDHARTTFAAWASSPAALPPSNVLTTVAGLDDATPISLDRPELLGMAAQGMGYGIGDGIVARDSAWLVGALNVQVNGEHSNLLSDQVANGNARRWILDVRSPIPPPPPEVDPAPQPPRLPPLPGVLDTGQAPQSTGAYGSGGVCGH